MGSVLRVLRRPGWVGLTVVVVLVCIAFVELGMWQLRRHDERAAMNVSLVASLEAPPISVDELVGATDRVPAGSDWRLVRATGVYDAEHQVLVRNQTRDGEVGYGVLVPLVRAYGPAMFVLRGWVPAGIDAGTPPEVPPPPRGEVTIEARLRPSDGADAGTDGLPAGQVRRVAIPAIAEGLPYAVLGGGYAALVPGAPGSSQELPGPLALQVPAPGSGPHLAYAVQWFLFGVIAVVGWGFLLRATVREDALQAGGTPGRSYTRPIDLPR